MLSLKEQYYLEERLTPLHIAAEKGDLNTVATLIAAKHPLDARDRYGWMPIHMAAHNGHTEIVNLFLEAGVNGNARVSHKDTALHLAAQNGHQDTVRLLVMQGVNINARNEYGHTPAQTAALHFQKEIAAQLTRLLPTEMHQQAPTLGRSFWYQLLSAPIPGLVTLLGKGIAFLGYQRQARRSIIISPAEACAVFDVPETVVSAVPVVQPVSQDAEKTKSVSLST